MVVAVQAVETFTIQTPVPLFAAPYVLDNAGGGNLNYAISPDGTESILVEQDLANAAPQINVVLNWFEELKARVPVP